MCCKEECSRNSSDPAPRASQSQGGIVLKIQVQQEARAEWGDQWWGTHLEHTGEDNAEAPTPFTAPGMGGPQQTVGTEPRNCRPVIPPHLRFSRKQGTQTINSFLKSQICNWYHFVDCRCFQVGWFPISFSSCDALNQFEEFGLCCPTFSFL